MPEQHRPGQIVKGVVCKGCGAGVPYLRPENPSDDWPLLEDLRDGFLAKCPACGRDFAYLLADIENLEVFLKQ